MSAAPRTGVVVAGRLGIAAVSVALYCVALALPAARFQIIGGEQPVFSGAKVLLLGWYALVGASNAGWLANAPYLFGLVMMMAGLRRTSLAAGLVALACGLHSLRLVGVTFDADEAGVKKMVLTGFDTAFYLWLAAMAVTLPGAFLFKSPPAVRVPYVPRPVA
jgi:hypothetical protein